MSNVLDTLKAEALASAIALNNWAANNEAEFTGWGDGDVPPGAADIVVRSDEALASLRNLPAPTIHTFFSLKYDWLTGGKTIRRKSWPVGDHVSSDGAEGGTAWYYVAERDDLERDYRFTFHDITATDWELA